jgi:hypothetical protein
MIGLFVLANFWQTISERQIQLGLHALKLAAFWRMDGLIMPGHLLIYPGQHHCFWLDSHTAV